MAVFGSALRVLFATGVTGLLASCGENQYVPPPPPTVSVTRPVQQDITRYFETTGTLSAVNSASLVARVQGYLQDIKYQDGAVVKAGTPLFVIEQEPYKLKYSSAQSAQAGAEASLKQLQADYQRQVDLANRQVASMATLDQALAARDGADAKVKQSEVDTKQAAIDLSYTQVNAPFDGTVTARQVSIGELVGGSTPTTLATIVQIDPIYVTFNISETDALNARAMLAKRGESAADLTGKLPVEVGLQTETGFPHRGVLDYIAPTVNTSTGTLQVRGVLTNADRVLRPGYFVRVRVPTSPAPTPALLVPDTALGSDQSGRYVLVIGPENVVEQRKVVIGPIRGDLRVIETGLKPEDSVIIGGQMRAIPGQKVEPQLRQVTAGK